MPEGHVTHRFAGELNRAFAERSVSVSSPQGRFAAAAAILDGSRFETAQAYGKNLFAEFLVPVDTSVVHIHLGLIGRLSWAEPRQLESPDTLRLRIEDGRQAADLRGPQTCALITPAERDAFVARLGPDPLRVDADPERAWQRISGSKRSIAALLMDQRVAAGVGNIFRAEVLFRQRMNPATPGAALKAGTWLQIWSDLVGLMPAAVEHGRIDTVEQEHSPEATGREPRDDRHGGELYVYRRAGQSCLVCGGVIRAGHLEGRNLYWCPKCQRRRC